MSSALFTEIFEYSRQEWSPAAKESSWSVELASTSTDGPRVHEYRYSFLIDTCREQKKIDSEKHCSRFVEEPERMLQISHGFVSYEKTTPPFLRKLLSAEEESTVDTLEESFTEPNEAFNLDEKQQSKREAVFGWLPPYLSLIGAVPRDHPPPPTIVSVFVEEPEATPTDSVPYPSAAEAEHAEQVPETVNDDSREGVGEVVGVAKTRGGAVGVAKYTRDPPPIIIPASLQLPRFIPINPCWDVSAALRIHGHGFWGPPQEGGYKSAVTGIIGPQPGARPPVGSIAGILGDTEQEEEDRAAYDVPGAGPGSKRDSSRAELPGDRAESSALHSSYVGAVGGKAKRDDHHMDKRVTTHPLTWVAPTALSSVLINMHFTVFFTLL